MWMPCECIFPPIWTSSSLCSPVAHHLGSLQMPRAWNGIALAGNWLCHLNMAQSSGANFVLSWGFLQVKFHFCLMIGKKISLFYQTGTYLPRACYSYLNLKNKTLPWHGISSLRSSEISLSSGRIKGIFFSCFEHTDCTSHCSLEDLTPDFCAGLSAGVLLWDSSREWIMSCAAPRSREENREEKKGGWFCEGHVTP